MMLEKFWKIYPYILNGDFPAEVKRMIPSPEDVENVRRLGGSMGKFQSTTKLLRLFEARAIIDALREHFDAEVFNQLDPFYAKMGVYVRNYHFEQGVPKLQLGQNLSRFRFFIWMMSLSSLLLSVMNSI